jgi:anti-anti-sigma regulatory factor
MRKALIAEWLNIDPTRVVHCVQEASGRLDGAGGELVLDFSAVVRVDPSALTAMETLAAAADAKSVRVGLRGVNVDIYKVLKLVKLAPRFNFLN